MWLTSICDPIAFFFTHVYKRRVRRSTFAEVSVDEFVRYFHIFERKFVCALANLSALVLLDKIISEKG